MHYFSIHDATTRDQLEMTTEHAKSSQRKSAIFFHTDEQKQVAFAVADDLQNFITQKLVDLRGFAITTAILVRAFFKPAPAETQQLHLEYDQCKPFFEWEKLGFKYVGPETIQVAEMPRKQSCQVIVCMDASSSMEGENWQQAVNGVKRLIENVKSQVQTISTKLEARIRETLFADSLCQPFCSKEKLLSVLEHELPKLTVEEIIATNGEIQGDSVKLDKFFKEQQNMDWRQTKLVVIHFAWNAKVVWEAPLNKDVDESCLYNRQGHYTYLGPPLKLAFDRLVATVEHKYSSHLFLFTDGECKYPSKEMKLIRMDLAKNVEKFRIEKRSRLSINLYCEGEKACLKEIDDEFCAMFAEHGLKQAFGGSVCKIKMHINPNQLGYAFEQNFTESFNELNAATVIGGHYALDTGSFDVDEKY